MTPSTTTTNTTTAPSTPTTRHQAPKILHKIWQPRSILPAPAPHRCRRNGTHRFSLLKSSQVLSIVRSDADHIFSSVRSTSVLADAVSAKVRELDLAQSRVSSTLLRLDAISQKSACIDAVKLSLDYEDYESVSEHVKKFLEIDSKFRLSRFFWVFSEGGVACL